MTMKNMPKFVYSSAAQVVTAVTKGVRPDGSKLNATMPRYSLTPAESSALIAFLKAI
jgi:hypothetical protein